MAEYEDVRMCSECQDNWNDLGNRFISSGISYRFLSEVTSDDVDFHLKAVSQRLKEFSLALENSAASLINYLQDNSHNFTYRDSRTPVWAGMPGGLGEIIGVHSGTKRVIEKTINNLILHDHDSASSHLVAVIEGYRLELHWIRLKSHLLDVPKSKTQSEKSLELMRDLSSSSDEQELGEDFHPMFSSSRAQRWDSTTEERTSRDEAPIEKDSGMEISELNAVPESESSFNDSFLTTLDTQIDEDKTENDPEATEKQAASQGPKEESATLRTDTSNDLFEQEPHEESGEEPINDETSAHEKKSLHSLKNPREPLNVIDKPNIGISTENDTDANSGISNDERKLPVIVVTPAEEVQGSRSSLSGKRVLLVIKEEQNIRDSRSNDNVLGTSSIKDKGDSLKVWLRQQGARVIGPGSSEKRLRKPLDLVICLGGDGTILKANSLLPSQIPPVLAFSMGRINFLSSIIFHEETSREMIKVILTEGNYDVINRQRLEITLINTTQKEVARVTALNEVVLRNSTQPSMCHLNLYINSQHLYTIQGDGLLVSTPTGSSAYNLSASGPLLHPALASFIITPMYPFPPSLRSVVVPGDVVIKITISHTSRLESITVLADCRTQLNLHRGEQIIVRMCEHPFPEVVSVSGHSATPNNIDEGWIHSIKALLNIPPSE